MSIATATDPYWLMSPHWPYEAKPNRTWKLVVKDNLLPNLFHNHRISEELLSVCIWHAGFESRPRRIVKLACDSRPMMVPKALALRLQMVPSES